MEQLSNITAQEKPLVSVIVITYNSAKYVIETLESVKAQTYRNIELIISDDCSVDETVEICRKWKNENRDRFVKTELITSYENTGIPGTCNRGIISARGEWIKYLAGDDMLIDSAIDNFIQFVLKNDEVKILDSKIDIYNEYLNKKIGSYNFQNNGFHDDNITAGEQLTMFIKRLDGQRLITTLGVFVRRDLINNIGGFDTRYRLLEDAPMWYKILKSNIKFYFLNEVTVKYRRHENSLSNPERAKRGDKIISDFKLTVDQFIWDNIYKHSDLLTQVNIIWLRFFSKLTLLFGNKGWFAEMFFKAGMLTQPIRLLWFKRTFQKMFSTGHS